MQFMAHQAALYNAIREAEFREYWAYGAIRSGKTVPIGAAFTRKMIREPGNYFATNSSAGNVWAVQWPLIRAFAAHGLASRPSGYAAATLPRFRWGDSQAWVVGLKNAGSHDNYMGRGQRAAVGTRRSTNVIRNLLICCSEGGRLTGDAASDGHEPGRPTGTGLPSTLRMSRNVTDGRSRRG